MLAVTVILTTTQVIIVEPLQVDQLAS